MTHATEPEVVEDPYLLIQQARRNALRTFLQGLAIDVLIAVALLVAQLVAQPLEQWQGWLAVGIALARTALGAAASYVMRRFVDGSKIPTPLPIVPEAAPAETADGETLTGERDFPAPSLMDLPAMSVESLATPAVVVNFYNGIPSGGTITEVETPEPKAPRRRRT